MRLDGDAGASQAMIVTANQAYGSDIGALLIARTHETRAASARS